MEIECRYAAYIEKQAQEVAAFRRDRSRDVPIPADFDFYAAAPILNVEEVQKLSKARPATRGAAAEISGVRPDSLLRLMRFIRREEWRERKAKARSERVARETERGGKVAAARDEDREKRQREKEERRKREAESARARVEATARMNPF